jgi:hypothetical protein
MEISWTQLKAITNSKALRLQSITLGDNYHIKALDGSFLLESILSTDVTQPDTADFVTNYLPSANKVIEQQDSDGAVFMRLKQAPTGWTFCLKAFEVTTSKLNSVHNCDAFGTPLTSVTVKYYDSLGADISSQSQLYLDLNCTKTVMDFEPTFDYYLIGGTMKAASVITSDTRVSVVAVPDVPFVAGGTRTMIENVNLRYLSTTDKIEADGRASKFLSYNAVYHTNKLRFIYHHEVGYQASCQVLMQFYRV